MTYQSALASDVTGCSPVWALNRAGEVFVRIGLCRQDPKGKEWTKIEGSMKCIRWEFYRCTGQNNGLLFILHRVRLIREFLECSKFLPVTN